MNKIGVGGGVHRHDASGRLNVCVCRELRVESSLREKTHLFVSVCV